MGLDRAHRLIKLVAVIALLGACSPASSTQPEASATITEDQATQLPTSTAIVAETEIPPTPTAELVGLGSTRVSEMDQMLQIFIPEGEFLMGSEDGDAKAADTAGVALSEGPEQLVFLPSFWIDKFEVTNQQYSLCVNAGICETPFLSRTFMEIEYYANPDYANYPVIYVDWYMARDYCTWADRRLPTEAEWEKAARGTEGNKYAWGNDPVTSEKANFCDGNCPKTHANHSFDDGYAETAPVGSFPEGASPYGVMDMAGNVWEWVTTIPAPYPYDADDGREEPDLRVGADVRDAYEGPQRSWRGGTWANGVWWLRATVRYHSVPWYWHNSLGFRCASSD